MWGGGLLVFVWGGARCGGGLVAIFGGVFLLVLAKFSFLRGDWALDYHSVWFSDFPNISYFPKS